MEILRWTAFGLIIVGVAALGIADSAAYWAMVDKVNARLPKEQQLSHAGWWFGKYLRIHREYRRLFPEGNLVRKVGVYNLLVCLGLLLAAALVGFPLPLLMFFAIGGGLSTWFLYFRASAS
jgi:hypothetical protein